MDIRTYFSTVNKNYDSIIAYLENNGMNNLIIVLDMDETIVSDLEEVPLSDYYHCSSDIRPLIKGAYSFLKNLQKYGTIHIVTGRKINRLKYTLRDLHIFNIENDNIHHYDESMNIKDWKSYMRKLLKANISIGDQSYDIDDSKFLIHNPYYKIGSNNMYKKI